MIQKCASAKYGSRGKSNLANQKITIKVHQSDLRLFSEKKTARASAMETLCDPVCRWYHETKNKFGMLIGAAGGHIVFEDIAQFYIDVTLIIIDHHCCSQKAQTIIN